MDGFEFNKIISSILLVGVMIMFVSIFTDVLYEPNLTPKVRGYDVALTGSNNVTSNSGGVATSVADLDEQKIEELIQNASASSGGKIFKSKCTTCHTNAQDAPNKIGPNLHNIVGRPKAKHQGYNYSSAMMAQQGNWDEKSLFLYLHKPNRYVPGTKMTFVGLAKLEDLADVIKFLENSGNK